MESKKTTTSGVIDIPNVWYNPLKRKICLQVMFVSTWKYLNQVILSLLKEKRKAFLGKKSVWQSLWLRVGLEDIDDHRGVDI